MWALSGRTAQPSYYTVFGQYRPVFADGPIVARFRGLLVAYSYGSFSALGVQTFKPC